MHGIENLAGKKILITGGAGFIGSKLAESLVLRNKVVILDNLSRKPVSLKGLLKHPNLSFVEADVMDEGKVREAAFGCNIILHLAAIAGVEGVLNNPLETLRINIIGTNNLLEAAKSLKRFERFVYFSTSEVYGTHAYNVKEDELTTLGGPGEPRWSYAISKLTAEHFVYNNYHQYKLPVAIIRPFNIYGPGQLGKIAVHKFIERAILDKPLEIAGDGSQIRAWCYLDDVVKGTKLCLMNKKAIGQIFNIGNPQGVSTVYNLANKIISLSKSKSKIVFKPHTYADVEIRVPNIDKAKTVLGYFPQVDMEEGLLRTISWFRQKK